jgi:O-antigen ligase
MNVLGVLVLAGCSAWALITAAGREGRPEGVLLALLALASGYAFGRIAAALLPAAAALVPALAIGVVVAVVPGGLSGEPLALPLRYGNANGALLSLAVGLACCAAASFGHTPAGSGKPPGSRRIGRIAALLLAAVLVGFAAATGSTAGAATAAGTLLCALAALRLRHRRAALVALALLPVLAVGGTVLLATTGAGDDLPRPVSAQLTEQRIRLWQDAVRLTEDAPALGIGPGLFRERSAVAAADPDTANPHSAALQLSSEQGLLGAALLGCAYLWVLAALWRSGRPTPVVLAAAAALVGLGTHAAIDYVLSYPTVTGAAGLLVGVSTARPVKEDGAAGRGRGRGSGGGVG